MRKSSVSRAASVMGHRSAAKLTPAERRERARKAARARSGPKGIHKLRTLAKKIGFSAAIAMKAGHDRA